MESIKSLQRTAGRISAKTRSLLVYALFTAITSGMAAATAKAQTFAEWFDQKNTQRRYLLQQIAALQVYSGYLKSGYQVARHGLGNISGSLQCENSLHENYYHRLDAANPLVKENPQVKDILMWQRAILGRVKATGNARGLTADEKEYLQRVGDAVLKDCSRQLEKLQTVITDNQLKMSDSERIAAIGKIHSSIQDDFRFACAFADQVSIFVLQRQKMKKNNDLEKSLYNIR